MCEVWTTAPRSSRSSGASRNVITLHRRRPPAATTAILTGALSRETLVPERSLPVSTPLAATPAAVARKLVIFADKDSLEVVAATVGEFALAEGATTTAIPGRTIDAPPARAVLLGFRYLTRRELVPRIHPCRYGLHAIARPDPC